ncbi:MAG: DUF2272 domain-containing protein [Alphaproteobacteria bacterium]|nr:DUF2272 domain-containing protein [Alphaproteobacteria bacterium]
MGVKIQLPLRASLLALILGACMERPPLVEDARAPYGHLADRPESPTHLPPFTRAPVSRGGGPIFSRSAAVAIALREWAMFGRQKAAFEPGAVEDSERNEASEGYWQRIGEYWWLGLPAHERRRRSTGIHDSDGNETVSPEARDPWSAAFISYVMRMAGARERFAYSGAHRVYITAAKRHRDMGGPDAPILAHPPDGHSPKPGDLVCHSRGNAQAITLDMLPDRLPAELAERWESHCDLVTAVGLDSIDVVGGNVGNAVALRRAPIDATGRLVCERPDLCPAPGLRWLAVIEVGYGDR